jgi:hypothetical protein
MFTLQTSFKPRLLGGGGGGVKSVSSDDCEYSKEENSEDFCLDYVEEFGPFSPLHSSSPPPLNCSQILSPLTVDFIPSQGL